MKKLLFLSMMCLMLVSSCRTADWCSRRFPPKVESDSMYSLVDTFYIRDTTFLVAADSNELELDINYICDSITRAKGASFKSHGTRSSSVVTISGNKLNIKNTCEQQLIKFQIRERQRTIKQRVSRIESRIFYASDPNPNWWQRLKSIIFCFFMWSGIVAWLLLLGYIIYRTRKFWRKLISFIPGIPSIIIVL